MRHFYTIFDPSFVGWTSRNSPEFFFLNARQCVLFPKAAQWQMRIWSCKLQQLHLIQIYVYILCILYEHIIFRFILSILYYIVLVFGSCTRCWLPREQTEMCIFKIHERCWARLSVHQMLRWVMAFWMTIQRKSCVWKCPQSTTMIYLAQVSKKRCESGGPDQLSQSLDAPRPGQGHAPLMKELITTEAWGYGCWAFVFVNGCSYRSFSWNHCVPTSWSVKSLTDIIRR